MQSIKRSHPPIVTSSLVAALFLALPVQAQQSGQRGPAQQGQHQGGERGAAQQRPAPAENVSDAELKQFAAAVAQLQEIKQQHSDQLAQAGDRNKARKIQSRMQQKMQQAIKDEGLAINRYVRIGEAVKRDQDLNSRVQELMEKR